MTPSWDERRRAEATARAAALRERGRLGVMDQERIDIFQEIDRAGIWLMFQPLTNLYGFYQRIGDVAGVVVHSGHPRPLQRFTAAHEYGHHVLGHSLSLDTQAEIEGQPTDAADPLAEIAAQAFAGALLMPLHLVNQVAADHNIDFGSPSPSQVYVLAVRFGVSYQAMRTQLRAYGLVTADVFGELDVPPVRIKESLGNGEAPADRRADLWVLTEDTAPTGMLLQVDDEVIVRVREAASTGYRWRLGDHDRSVLALIDDRCVEPPDGEVLGATRTRSLRFRAGEPGVSSVRLGLSRAFGAGTQIETLNVDIAVASPVTGDSPSGLYVDQHAKLAARTR